MDQIDHIGIAVSDLEKAARLYTLLLGKPRYKTETVVSEQVEVAFFACGETKLELLASKTADGTIARFIEKQGEGLHHIAFEVADIKAEMRRLKEAGFEPIDAEPRSGADHKLVCFLHPRSTGRVLVELCQTIP